MTLRALFRLLALKLPVFAIALHATALFAAGVPSESVGKFETETQAVGAVPGALAYEFSGGRLLAFTADGNFAEVADDGRVLEGSIGAGAQRALLSSSTDELLLLAKFDRDWRGFRLRIDDRRMNVLGEFSLPSGLTPLSGAHSSGSWVVAADDPASATSVLLRANPSGEIAMLSQAPVRILGIAVQRDGDYPKLVAIGPHGDGLAAALFDARTGRWSIPRTGGPALGGGPVFPVGIGSVGIAQRDQLAVFNLNARAWFPVFEWPGGGDVLAARQDGRLFEFLQRAADDHLALVRLTCRPSHGRLHWLDYGVLAAFFIGLVWVSLSHARGAQSSEQYFRGSKKIPWLAAGMSVVATRLSSTSLVSIPAKSFATNLQYALVPLTNVVGAALMSAFFLKFFVRLNVTSGYEYLEKRFNVAVRTVGSVNYLAYELARVGLLILVPAVVVAAVTPIDLRLAIVVMGLVATAYTMAGGLEGVVRADVYQISVKIAGLAVAAVIVFFLLDGHPGQWAATAWEAGRLRMVDWHWDFTRDTIWVFILFWLTDGLKSYVANQTIIQRFISTKDERAARRTIWASAWIGMGVTFLLLLIGTGLFLFYHQSPGRLDLTMTKPDGVFPWFIVFELPMGVAGLLIAALFAAAMSSLDGALNSTSTVAVTDFYKRFARGATDSTAVRLGRVLVVLIGLGGTGVAVLLSGMSGRSLFDAMLMLIGLFGGGLGGLFLIGMLSTRVGAAAALIGFICSVAVQTYVALGTPLHFLVFMFTGMSSCMGCAYLASFVFRERRPLEGLTIHTTK